MASPRLAQIPELLDGVTGYVFDKDGTLTDLDRRWVPFMESLVADALRTLGIDSEYLVPVLAAIGVADGRMVPDGLAAAGNVREIGAILTAELGPLCSEPSSIVPTLAESQGRAAAGPLVPLGDMSVSLTTLEGLGNRLGLATADSRDSSEQELEQLDIARLFTAVRCGDDKGPVKPSGQVLKEICAQWDLDVSEVVFVGDSDGDRRTAENAGMRFIGVRGENNAERWPADAWIASIDEIVAVI